MLPLALGAILLLGGSLRSAGGLQFTASVNLVEVYATVTDDHGPVTGLTAADFGVFEDDEPQAIAAFAAGDFPLAIAVGIDHSFSIPRDRLVRMVAAVRQFIAALRADDRVMIVGIRSETEVLAPLGSDRAGALAALSRIEPWGTTPLYDATLDAVAAIQSAGGRRALILLSDGEDRDSRISAAEIVDRVRRSDVLVYPIGIGRTRPPVFAELASASGGRSFFAANAAMLPETLTAIAAELRSQYLLGYSPTRPPGRPAGWRSIRVSVNHPAARVRSRDGYQSK